jgi:hypothetical protein
MDTQRAISLVAGCLVTVVGWTAACSNDSTDDAVTAGAGSGGKISNTAGKSSQAGMDPVGGGGVAESAGGVGAGGAGIAGAEAIGGAGGGPEGAGGAPEGAGGSADPGAGGQAGDPSQAGAAGAGGASASCASARTQLLGPVASVSTGNVEITSAVDAATVTLRVDASAGGFMAAATNPYIYLNLASKLRVELSDPEADGSLAWDLALKRDNLRSNGGDSGPGAAQVATLEGADFDATTAAAADSADFGVDRFIDSASCEPVTDGVGKPLTRFDGWYDYDGAAMTLSPANRVYLVRAATGTTLYKLQITGYYVDLPDGLGGTLKKSAVYSLRYAAL